MELGLTWCGLCKFPKRFPRCFRRYPVYSIWRAAKVNNLGSLFSRMTCPGYQEGVHATFTVTLDKATAHRSKIKSLKSCCQSTTLAWTPYKSNELTCVLQQHKGLFQLASFRLSPCLCSESFHQQDVVGIKPTKTFSSAIPFVKIFGPRGRKII